jgi:hypothetical protein
LESEDTLPVPLVVGVGWVEIDVNVVVATVVKSDTGDVVDLVVVIDVEADANEVEVDEDLSLVVDEVHTARAGGALPLPSLIAMLMTNAGLALPLSPNTVGWCQKRGNGNKSGHEDLRTIM